MSREVARAAVNNIMAQFQDIASNIVEATKDGKFDAFETIAVSGRILPLIATISAGVMRVDTSTKEDILFILKNDKLTFSE